MLIRVSGTGVEAVKGREGSFTGGIPAIVPFCQSDRTVKMHGNPYYVSSIIHIGFRKGAAGSNK
jgi:hypothetical protein